MRSTQGKIERCHRSVKNLLLPEFYYLPQKPGQRIGEWVGYYQDLYNETPDNLTPADVFFDREQEKLQQREKSKSLPSLKEEKVILASNSRIRESAPSLTGSGVHFY
jgi:hypothetical protein